MPTKKQANDGANLWLNSRVKKVYRLAKLGIMSDKTNPDMNDSDIMIVFLELYYKKPFSELEKEADGKN